MEIQRLDSVIDIPTKATREEDTTSLPTRSSTDRHPGYPANQQVKSRLLSLPAELQLQIWEWAVISAEPLYINCPCDSSFGGWTEEYYADQERWESGEKQPPWQPTITQVCRSIRADALPMFYKLNAFQAGYCYETNTETVIDWLKVIGLENRKLMRGFYFFDANPQHDWRVAKDLKKIQRSALFRELGGKMTSSYSDAGCRHEVVFGGEDGDEELEALESLFGQQSLT